MMLEVEMSSNKKRDRAGDREGCHDGDSTQPGDGVLMDVPFGGWGRCPPFGKSDVAHCPGEHSGRKCSKDKRAKTQGQHFPLPCPHRLRAKSEYRGRKWRTSTARCRCKKSTLLDPIPGIKAFAQT